MDLVILERDSSPEVETQHRDGGWDFHVSLGPYPGQAVQLLLTEMAHRTRGWKHTFVVGFGAGLAGFVATTVAAWLDLPSLVLVRGNDFDRDWFAGEGWTREALARATAIGAVATVQVERLQRLFPGKPVHWTPNGVDLETWGRLLPRERERADRIRAELGGDGRRILGLFGELKFKKWAAPFLRALRDSGRIQEVALLVAGNLDADTHTVLEDPALAPDRQLRLPFLPRDALPPHYAACHFVCLPSLFDGMPNVLLEAMAAGAVPIVSNAGGLPDVVQDGETGFVFPASDREAAVEALERALDLDEAERLAMVERARRRLAQEFSQEAEVDRILALMSACRHQAPCLNM